jgi:pantoate--beta-alanine ligase
MELKRSAADMRATMVRAHRDELTIAFVPTMGAFHEGHLSLLRAARAAGDLVAVSIYVNPLQFEAREDLASYPRAPERDLELARAEGVDVAFAPSVDEMQPPGRTTVVTVGRLAEVLEGAARPGHFDGVCAVVAQLLNIVTPHIIFLGQKDAQQVAVLRRMVTDLSFATEIRVCPTVREPDGLALSSRNAYLDSEERARASVLFRALEAGAKRWTAGGSVADTEHEMRAVVSATAGVLLDYARAVDPESFEAPGKGGAPLLLIAARVGRARLIDNLQVEG